MGGFSAVLGNHHSWVPEVDGSYGNQFRDFVNHCEGTKGSADFVPIFL